VSPGQLAIVATHDLSNEELIRADGIDTAPVEGSITEHTASKVSLRAFAREQMLEKNLLVGCASTTSRPNTKAGQALKALRDKLQEESHGSGSPRPGLQAAGAGNAPALPLAVEAQKVTASPIPAQSHEVVSLDKERLVIVSANSRADLQGPDRLTLGVGSA